MWLEKGICDCADGFLKCVSQPVPGWIWNGVLVVGQQQTAPSKLSCLVQKKLVHLSPFHQQHFVWREAPTRQYLKVPRLLSSQPELTKETVWSCAMTLSRGTEICGCDLQSASSCDDGVSSWLDLWEFGLSPFQSLLHCSLTSLALEFDLFQVPPKSLEQYSCLQSSGYC